MRIRLALAVWLLAVLHPCWGQHEPSLRATTDLDVISLGDRLTLAIEVEHSAGQTVVWPATTDTLGSFEVVSVAELQPIVEDGHQTSTRLYSLTTFELGELEIPAIEILVADSTDAEAALLTTEPLTVLVESVGIDEGGDIRNVKDPLEIPRNWLLLIPWALLVVAVASLSYWLYRRHRSRKQAPRQLMARSVPPRPPHEVAYAALNRLEAERLPEKGLIKQFYIEVSEIVRTYLEGRYPIDALEMTSHEVLRELKGVGLEPEVFDLFPPFFARADLVKFAKHRPDVETCNEMIPMARLLVDETRTRSVRDPSEDGAGEVKPADMAAAEATTTTG